MTFFCLVMLLSLPAGLLGGITGTGASLMLLPTLTLWLGPKTAIPVMAIASIMANVGRLAAWPDKVHWPSFRAYSVAAIPAAMVGVSLLVWLPSSEIDAILGCFLICLVPVRRALQTAGISIGSHGLCGCGAAIGLLTGMLQTTGPLSVVVFSLSGLRNGALLATEAAISLAVYGTKTSTLATLGSLDRTMILTGVIVGACRAAGGFWGKKIILRSNQRAVSFLLDGVVFLSGVALMVR